MSCFTVILLYPDYASDNYGEDHLIIRVNAKTVAEAQVKVQKWAAGAHFSDPSADHEELLEDIENHYEDWAVLAVFKGNHEDIKDTK